MPTNENIALGRPCWVDLNSAKLSDVKPFYTALFNWDYQEMGEEFGNYNIVSGKHGPVGGAMQHDPAFMGPEPAGWSHYFAVEDAQKTLDAVATAGGQQTVPPMAVADQGAMAEGIDTTGAGFGIWQQGTLKGFAAWGEHGYPAWFELRTGDADKAVEFYKSILPVSVGDSESAEDMKYFTLDVDGEQSAGVWETTEGLKAGDAAKWFVYFSVDDTDAAVALVQEQGGSVVTEAMDSPYGRLATVADPAGAVFIIVS